MKLIYVAGPYRAETVHGILENIRAAEKVAIEVWRSGCYALCPHKNSSFFDGLVDDKLFLDGTQEMLKRSDGLVLIPGWEESSGTLDELEMAVELNKPVFETYRFLRSNEAMHPARVMELVEKNRNFARSREVCDAVPA